jgi:site-specific DNA-methyltransferase (cytosine-N4-specific)
MMTSLETKYSLLTGDCIELLKTLPDESVQTCVTSPPYWGLRNYDMDGQIGAELELADYIEQLCKVFDEVNRVLKATGTLWLNLGDTYAGGGNSSGGDTKLQLSNKGSQSIKTKLQGNPEFNKNRPSRELTKLGNKTVPKGLKSKDLIGLPWRVALALQSRGWYLRSDIIWHKPNPMPESVKDRPTKSHEYLFLFAKNEIYLYNSDAIKETAVSETGSRNKRDVWSVPVASYKGAHFATFPLKLITPCVLAGSNPGDLVLDPFSGAATTGLAALHNGREYIGLELNPEYNKLAEERFKKSLNCKV